MGTDKLIASLIEHGPIGVVAAVSLWWAIKKDRQVASMTKRLVEKAEKDADKYYQFALAQGRLISDLTDSVNNRVSKDTIHD